jgi:hypothetical protein
MPKCKVVESLGGMPVEAKESYDISSYLDQGEGNLDSDVNIAKLALALEIDAAIAYTQEIAKLKTPELITAGASIGSDEYRPRYSNKSRLYCFRYKYRLCSRLFY